MGMQEERLTLKVPAKVNLYLEILNRRADGYHNLRSVVVPISLYDDVVIERADRIETHMEAAGAAGGGAPRALPDSEQNLATRAARLLQAHTQCPDGARIRIVKRIPLGGGLGGGSADAAAVLIGLNDLWKQGLSRRDLQTLGAQIGCDVPVLLHGGPARMEGIGEQVTGIETRRAGGPNWWLVLVHPGFCVPTRDIYARYAGCLTSGRGDYKSMVSSVEEGSFTGAVASLFNSLEKTVFRKYPLIELMAEKLGTAGAEGVLLSGSGATVFGLVRDERHARDVAGRVRAEAGVPVWCEVARTLPDGVMVAHGPLEARV